MYPIMNLRNYKQDIHWYLRRLEETVIVTLKKLGLQGRRIDGLTGVWVDGCKVAVSTRMGICLLSSSRMLFLGARTFLIGRFKMYAFAYLLCRSPQSCHSHVSAGVHI